MNSHDFIIKYKKGAEMPADFLLEQIQIFTPDLPLLLAQDKSAYAVIEFLHHGNVFTKYAVMVAIDIRRQAPSQKVFMSNESVNMAQASEWFNMLQHCRQIAAQHNIATLSPKGRWCG